MNYKIEYCRYLIQRGEKRAIFKHIKLDNMSQDEADFLVQVAVPPDKLNTRFCEPMCLALMAINTPKAIRILRDHYFDVLLSKDNLMKRIHRVIDDGFRDDLLTFIQLTYQTLEQKVYFETSAIYAAGRFIRHRQTEYAPTPGSKTHSLFHAMMAAGRMHDVRFVPILKYILESNHYDFRQLIPDTPRCGLVALQALSLMRDPELDAYIQPYLDQWHVAIFTELANAPLLERKTLDHVPDFAFQQPKFIDYIAESIIHISDDANAKIALDIISRVIKASKELPNQDDAIARVMTIVHQTQHDFIRRHILKMVTAYDHPAIHEFAMTYMRKPTNAIIAHRCIYILYTAQFASLEVAHIILNNVNLPRAQRPFRIDIAFLRYLTLIDTPEAHAFILSCVRDKPFNLHDAWFFDLLASIAHRHDESFIYLVDALDNEDSEIQRNAIRALSRCGARAIPILKTILRQFTFDNYSNTPNLTELHHDRLIPEIINLYLASYDPPSWIKSALKRIGTESAYEALLLLETEN